MLMNVNDEMFQISLKRFIQKKTANAIKFKFPSFQFEGFELKSKIHSK